MVQSLYVHIPFCSHICGYCDFSKVLYNEKWAYSYVEELKKELSSLNLKHKLKTIYIGGGTPTCLPYPLLESLLMELGAHLDENGEFTVEANPENLNDELLSLLKRHKVNRLSIGVESTNRRFLSLMGRKHSFEDVAKAVEKAKKISFENISLDLIYALPDETLLDLEKDLSSLLSLKVPHLSTYSLTIEKGTAFHWKGYKEKDQDEAGAMYELILKRLREAGYTRYEVSNFAISEDYRSKHNLTYWHDENYYAIGLGASGYVGRIRYKNTLSLAKYLRGEHLEEKEEVSEKEELKEYLLTNLRLEEGFSLRDFEKRFGFSFRERFQEVINHLRLDSLAKLKDDRFMATDRGLELLDRVLLTFFVAIN